MAEFKYKVVIKADFWGKGVSETFIYTDHFLVSFEAGESNAHYAIDTAKYLEKSWDMYVTQQGFHAPKYRVHVIIKKELPNALGLAYMPTWIHNAYLEILAGQSEHSLKETSSHEYFHITQYEYDYNEHRWIIEATATVAEDYVFPEVPGYLRFENHWYERWDKGMSLNSLHDYFEYGGSLFFKYLMENVHGTSIQGKSVTEMALLKSIWERAATVKGDNTLPSIMETIGGLPEENKKYNKAFGDFAAAIFVKEKVPDFSFRRGNELTGKLNPEKLPGQYYTFNLNKTSGEIVSSIEEVLVYLTAKYFQFSIPTMKEPQPLYLFVVGSRDHGLQMRAITESKKEKKVYTPEEKEGGPATQLTLPKVGGEGDESIQTVVLAISNPHRKDLARFVIRSIIGEVPYLKEVKIKKRNDRDIYHGKWVADQYTKVGTRTLSTRKEPLKIEAGKRTDLEMELQFSNPILGDPDVSFLDGAQKLGEVRLSSSKKSKDEKSWTASLQLPSLTKKTKELTLRVLVEDFKRDPLDVDPASVAKLDDNGARWLHYESDEPQRAYGGADQNHRFKLQHEGGKSIVILMDASGSMKDNQKIQKAKRSAIETIQNMSSQDELSFWIFSDCGNVRMVQGFTSETKNLIQAVQSIEPQSGTPLALGIRQGGNYLLKEAANEEKILVVLSDGEESCEGDPQAEAQLLATKNLQIKYGPYFSKGKKGGEGEQAPEEDVPSPEEKETPPKEDPLPPEAKEEKEDEAPCELQSWKSYEAKKEGSDIYYTVLTYEEHQKDKDCFIKGKIDRYGVYYGEAVGDPDSLKWGINPNPSSTEEDQATYKTNQVLFLKLAKKYKERSHYAQEDILKEVDRLVRRELKK